MVIEIWNSFRRMPFWVQIWVGVILVPVNLMSILFWSSPGAPLIALLAVGGMSINLPIMLLDRGFSKAMAIPHVILWVPLIVVLIWWLSAALDGLYPRYLLLLMIVDLISLSFDIPDCLKWLKGDRDIA